MLVHWLSLLIENLLLNRFLILIFNKCPLVLVRLCLLCLLITLVFILFRLFQSKLKTCLVLLLGNGRNQVKTFDTSTVLFRTNRRNIWVLGERHPVQLECFLSLNYVICRHCRCWWGRFHLHSPLLHHFPPTLIVSLPAFVRSNLRTRGLILYFVIIISSFQVLSWAYKDIVTLSVIDWLGWSNLDPVWGNGLEKLFFFLAWGRLWDQHVTWVRFRQFFARHGGDFSGWGVDGWGIVPRTFLDQWTQAELFETFDVLEVLEFELLGDGSWVEGCFLCSHRSLLLVRLGYRHVLLDLVSGMRLALEPDKTLSCKLLSCSPQALLAWSGVPLEHQLIKRGAGSNQRACWSTWRGNRCLPGRIRSGALRRHTLTLLPSWLLLQHR